METCNCCYKEFTPGWDSHQLQHRCIACGRYYIIYICFGCLLNSEQCKVMCKSYERDRKIDVVLDDKL